MRVRKFEMSYVQRLYENHLEEEVKNWIPNESYADIEETGGVIEFYIDCVNKIHLPFVLAVESKETGELIGDTGINKVDGNSYKVEIGYTICKKYSGNGYAIELVNEMTRFACKRFLISKNHSYCSSRKRVIFSKRIPTFLSLIRNFSHSFSLFGS